MSGDSENNDVNEEEQTQIFVHTPTKTVPIEVTLSVKVKDIKNNIRNRMRCISGDVCRSFGGMVPRQSGVLKACGVVNEGIFVMCGRLRGGAVHKSKKPSKMTEKQQKARESSFSDASGEDQARKS